MHCQSRFLVFKNFVVPAKAMLALLPGIVGICFSFSLAVEAAPMVVRQSLAVTARVLEVDCTKRPVKMKACAAVVVTTETAQAENAKTVITTVLYY
jgi:hypothetical protein